MPVPPALSSESRFSGKDGVAHVAHCARGNAAFPCVSARLRVLAAAERYLYSGARRGYKSVAIGGPHVSSGSGRRGMRRTTSAVEALAACCLRAMLEPLRRPLLWYYG